MILKLGMKNQAMELYKVCKNHDPGMNLNFFTARPVHSNGKNRKMSLKAENLLGMSKWIEDLCL